MQSRPTSISWWILLVVPALIGLSILGSVSCNRARHAPSQGRQVITPELAARSTIPDPAAVACATCHAKQFKDWLGSHHAWANRLIDPTRDHAAFEPPRTMKVGSFTTQTAKQRDGYTVTQTHQDGAPSNDIPEAVLGLDPLHQYLVSAGNGRLQVLDMAYDPRSNEWFNVFGDEDRQLHEWGFWRNRGNNWNSQCAFCHMTGLQKNYDPQTDVYQTTWDAMGISCAQCHGSMEDHLKNPEAPIPESEQPDRLHTMDTCASCHARREELTGNFHAGERFNDHYRLILANDPQVYYPDGQVIQENFVYGSFQMSRMAHQGVTCLDCHDPHSAELKLPAQNNTLCLSCHAAPGKNGAIPIVPTEHSHHGIQSAGNRCIECHMPVTVYMQRDARRDHSFTSPDPLLTKELGIPNACSTCHDDKSIDWAIENVDRWYGPKMKERRARSRTRALARIQQGDADGLDDLLTHIRSEPIPLWRATLLEAAAPWAADPAVNAALRTALQDTNEVVRATAVRALRGTPDSDHLLKPMRKDSSRLVRIDAAWATLGSLDREPVSYREVIDYLNVISDQPSGVVRQTQKALAEGHPELAVKWMKKAAAWDPSAGTFHLLGQTHYTTGDSAQAEEQFLKAIEMDPDNAEHLYSMALLYGEKNQIEKSAEFLYRTVTAEPSFGRAWYNLGLARAQLQQLDLAVEALHKAEEYMPGSPEPAYAAATIYLRQNKMLQAREQAERALRMDPGHVPSRQLLNQAPTPAPGQ